MGVPPPLGRLDGLRGFKRTLRDDVESFPAALRQTFVSRRLPYGAQTREHGGGVGETQFGHALDQLFLGAVVSERAAPDPRRRRIFRNRTAAVSLHLVGEDL